MWKGGFVCQNKSLNAIEIKNISKWKKGDGSKCMHTTICALAFTWRWSYICNVFIRNINLTTSHVGISDYVISCTTSNTMPLSVFNKKCNVFTRLLNTKVILKKHSEYTCISNQWWVQRITSVYCSECIKPFEISIKCIFKIKGSKVIRSLHVYLIQINDRQEIQFQTVNNDYCQ